MRFLEANGIQYDHYLAFDYETFNTHVSENGQIMAEALRDADFGPEDKIHLDVFAHSMGTMVTRSMVEQHGGEDFVDRCFLAGPPNAGSRLAELKRLVPWVGTLLLNQAGPTPPAVIASWALKKITDDAVGGDDLRPSSEFIKQLNAIDRKATVPYYILAGRNELPAEAEGAWKRLFSALNRTGDLALDTFFNDQHDLVINVQSMLNVRNGKYPDKLLHTKVLKCNHFQYFGSGEGQETLLAWLKA
jgi:pimeloyl-ACP methyl ester carboxylesterase